MSENQKSFYIGVDVGTASVRAALVSEAGVVIKKTSKQIKINNPKQGTNQWYFPKLYTREKSKNLRYKNVIKHEKSPPAPRFSNNHKYPLQTNLVKPPMTPPPSCISN